MSAAAPAAAERRVAAVDLAALAVLAVALGFVLLMVARTPWKDDVAWLLWVARKWLAGRELYVDLVEVNPPLVIWIYAIPAALADWLGIGAKAAAAVFFSLLLLGAAWWTACLLHGRAPLFSRRIPVFSAIATVMLVLPGVEFGQREHLMAFGVLPYLVLFVRNLDGEREPRGQAAAAGALAALGCALKPSYALAIALLEAVSWLRGHRRPRAALVAFLATTGLYALSIPLFAPEFIEKAMPLALALYGGTDTPVWHILAESRNLLFGQAVAIALCLAIGRAFGGGPTFLRHLYLALVAFGVACTVLFVLQGKDWFYHRLPATSATVLALMLWLAVAGRAALAGAAPGRGRLRGAMAAACVALLAFGTANAQRVLPWVQAAAEPSLSTEVRLVRLIKREKARTYIAFSEWIGLGFPVVNEAGVSWASRFDSMWALKGELWRARRDGRPPKQWPIRRWVARDFVAGCPDIAVVDTREGINYIEVLVASDVEFARAWSAYAEIAAFDGLRIYKREEAGCASEPLPPGDSRKPLAAAGH